MANHSDTIETANRKIAAIDKRIDIVRDEMRRHVSPREQMSAFACQRAWDSVPGLQGFDHSLFARRGRWQSIRDAAETKVAEAAERRAKRAYAAEAQKRFIASRHSCPTCGHEHFAAIRIERGYSMVRLTIEDKQIIREILIAAREAGDERVTERLTRRFSTAFDEIQRDQKRAALAAA